MKQKFIDKIDEAVKQLGYDNRSQLVRDAIVEKLVAGGIKVPPELSQAPDRVGKGGPRKVAPLHRSHPTRLTYPKGSFHHSTVLNDAHSEPPLKDKGNLDVSSAVTSALAKGQASASALVSNQTPESEPSQKVDAPSAGKSARGRGTGGRSNKQPAAPAAAPK
ncbi:MAG TPA: ribbon-helix-helix domain-containing protein [Clostridia bacterium]|nr:ribbon-helix-helix domain-containing protein [Clostridia bacterium]